MRMMTIGLGKQYRIGMRHEAGFRNVAKYVPVFGETIIENAPVLFAMTAVGNALGETCKIAAIRAEDIVEKEPPFLKETFTYMPRILVDSCDVLVVDQTGRNFSGDGMDPNITGTFCIPYASDSINAQRVCVLDSSPEAYGNGVGLGYPSATTKRVFNQLDLVSTYPNTIICTVPSEVRIPIVMKSDKEAIQVCAHAYNEIDKKNPRIVWIPDNLYLEHIMLSEVYYNEVRDHLGITAESEPRYLPFDEDGNLW